MLSALAFLVDNAVSLLNFTMLLFVLVERQQRTLRFERIEKTLDSLKDSLEVARAQRFSRIENDIEDLQYDAEKRNG
jgi:hypothetical protein